MHEKRRVLLMYRLFVGLLMKEFQQKLGGSWAFVLRDVINRLLHLIQEMDILKFVIFLVYQYANSGAAGCPK